MGQDTPSVIQGALPEQRLGSQPYVSGQQYTAAQPYTAAAQPYTAAAQPYIAPYNNMPAMSARPTEPMGYFGQGGQLPFVLTEEQLLQQQQLLREKQEFDAWRTSRAQAKTQPQPEIISEGPIPAEVNVEVNVDSSERSASVAKARPKDRVWGTLEIDMYATVSNSLLPRLMSPIPDPRAIVVDALSQVWQGRSLLVNVHVSNHSPCSTEFFRRSHSDGRDDSHSPWWPNQLCLPHLLRLCVEHPLILPYRRDLLSQQNQKYISDEMSYHLHAWRLSCDTIRQQGFQTRSLGSQQLLGGPQPIACTTIGGFASFDGCRARF